MWGSLSPFSLAISISYIHKPAHIHPVACLEDCGGTLSEIRTLL